MSEAYTTAVWVPKAGQEQAFVDAWRGFADWAQSRPGAGTLRLARDVTDATRYVSFGRWSSLEAAHVWKADAEFPARMAKVQEHVAQFMPAELEVVMTAGHPAPM